MAPVPGRGIQHSAGPSDECSDGQIGIRGWKLPPVTVTSPETTRQRRIRPSQQPRRERSARNPAVVQPSPPLAATTGVTSGSATSGSAGSSAHCRQRDPHQRRGIQRAPGRAGRRGAGGVPGPDRHAALRRGQSQPVLPARLQPRPRHRPRHHGRRHAGQHAHPWPRPGLRRPQLPDPRADPAVRCPQGSLLRRRRRLLLRRRGRSTTSTSCRSTSREVTVGSFGYWRGAGRRSAAVGAGTLLVGARRHQTTTARGTCRTSCASSTASCATARAPRPTASDAHRHGLYNRWNSTDQVAQRAIDQGIIGRFGTLDPTDGGTSSRYSLSGRWAHSSDSAHTRSTPMSIRSTLKLFNNFTYFLDDPVNGDQFSQTDRRTLCGLRRAATPSMARLAGSKRRPASACRAATTTSRSACSTRCSARAVDRPRRRRAGRQRRLSTPRTPRAGPTGCAPVGVRADYFAGQVASDTPANSGNARRR